MPYGAQLLYYDHPLSLFVSYFWFWESLPWPIKYMIRTQDSRVNWELILYMGSGDPDPNRAQRTDGVCGAIQSNMGLGRFFHAEPDNFFNYMLVILLNY